MSEVDEIDMMRTVDLAPEGAHLGGPRPLIGSLNEIYRVSLLLLAHRLRRGPWELSLVIRADGVGRSIRRRAVK